MSTSGHPGGQHPPATPAAQTKPHPHERPRRSRRGLWLTLGSILGVLAVACGLLAYFVVIPILQQDAEISAAAVAARSFCADMTSQNYSTAYDMFSKNYQSSVTEDQFVQKSKLRDQLDGNVTSCPIPTSGPNVSAGVNTVTLFVSMTRKATTQGSVTLIKQDGVWKLDKIDDALLGENVAPLLVANTFCAALVSGDYATVYAQLSSDYQAQYTESAFEANFKSILSSLGPDAAISSCAPVVSTYKAPQTVSSGTPTATTATGSSADEATVNVALDLSVNGAALGQPITIALTLKQESGVWKIDQQQAVPSV